MRLSHRFLLFLLSALAPLVAAAQYRMMPAMPAPEREVRAVWLTTLMGLDWPRTKANSDERRQRQKDELLHTLDALQQAGINTVMLQTRVRSTTIYPSALEPWDECLSGTYGRSPGYDALAFAIEACHARGMQVHAWVVAFPICSVAQARQQGRSALPAKHPELCRRSGDKWMMDPGVPATADYLATLCTEIVSRYDVDGIHLDYIRYPEKGIPWDDRATYRRYGQGKSLAAWRTANVDRVVETVSRAVKSVRPWLVMSCSPVGKYADLPRQSSYGWNARDAVNQDAQKWLARGWMDWLLPMMYFDGQHFYPFAADWQENAHGRVVAPGLGIYCLSPREKDWDLTTITRQLNVVRTLGMGGVAYYRSRFLTDNTKGLLDYLQNAFQRTPVLPPAMTWADSIAPATPQVKVHLEGPTLHFRWAPVQDDTPVTYTIYRLPTDSTAQPERVAHGLRQTTYSLTPALPRDRHARYAVCATDAYGNESAVVEGVNSQRLGGEQQAAATIVVTDTLTLPDGLSDGLWLQITDAAGREVCRLPRAQNVVVSALAPGSYRLNIIGRKGAAHPAMRFWKAA